METRASFVLMGFFALAAIAGAFGFVYWFQNRGAAADRVTYRVVYDGQVPGLRTGGNVLFNGVRVGEVTDVALDDPSKVAVIVSVDRATPIRQDTKVGLDFQGLTGIASVSLRGGSPDAPKLVAEKGQLPTLYSTPGASQDVIEAARVALQSVTKLVTDNQDAMKNTIKSLETFSATLAKNSERVDSIFKRVDNISIGVERLTGGKDTKGELYEAASSIRELAENLDKRTSSLVRDARRTFIDIDLAVKNFDRNPTRVIFGGPTVFPPKPQPKPQRSAVPAGFPRLPISK